MGHDGFQAVGTGLTVYEDDQVVEGPVVYLGRLQHALQTAEDGDLDYVVSPKVESVHTVWMECHEDYLQTLGISREEEGSH